MVAKKILENWLYWIVINIVSIYLYFHRDLTLTSLLFATYTIIAIFGYFHWLKKMKKQMLKIIVTGPESSGKTTFVKRFLIILIYHTIRNMLVNILKN